MSQSSYTQENNNQDTVEIHGCIVCGKIYEVLVVRTPDNRILDCKVTSPGGHIVKVEHQPLVACNSHSTEAIEAAYKRWKSRNDDEPDEDYEKK